MARLDIGEALGEGFRLVGRRPLDAMVWGVVYFVFAAIPAFALFYWLAGDWADLMRQATASPDMANPAKMMAEQMRLQAVQPLMFLGSLVGRSLVFAAVFRAVLTPRDRGFCYLRFGKTELWLGLVLLVQWVCMFLLLIVLLIPLMIFWVPTFISGAQHSFAGWEVPVGLIGCVLAFAVYIWLFVRFSMAAPMTFAARQFRLFESWTMTRGHGLGLFGLYLVVAVVACVIGLIVEIVIFGIGFAVLASTGLDSTGIEAFFRHPPRELFVTVAPYALGIGLVLSAFWGMYLTLFLAPWARAYAQLAGEPEAP